MISHVSFRLWKWQLVILIPKQAQCSREARRAPLSLMPGTAVDAEGGEASQSVGLKLVSVVTFRAKRQNYFPQGR